MDPTKLIRVWVGSAGKEKALNQVLCHKILLTPIVENKSGQLMFDLTIIDKQRRNKYVRCISSHEDEIGVHFGRVI